MNESQLEELINELDKGNTKQRRAAAYKLGNSKDALAVTALIRAYDDTDYLVRQNAVDSLMKIGSNEAIDFIKTKGISSEALPRKLVTNNAILIVKPNGDLLIKPRRRRTFIGFALVMLLSTGAIFFLVNAFSDGISFNLLMLSMFLGGWAYYLASTSWNDMRKPSLTIEKTARQVCQSGGQYSQSWPFSAFVGVSSVISGSFGRKSQQGGERFQILTLCQCRFCQDPRALRVLLVLLGLQVALLLVVCFLVGLLRVVVCLLLEKFQQLFFQP